MRRLACGDVADPFFPERGDGQKRYGVTPDLGFFICRSALTPLESFIGVNVCPNLLVWSLLKFRVCHLQVVLVQLSSFLIISFIMAPTAVDTSGRMLNGFSDRKIDTMNPHDLVEFDKSLTPKKYEIKGTDPNSKILFTDVNIIDSTGADPFRGDVYIEGMKQDSLENCTDKCLRRAH